MLPPPATVTQQMIHGRALYVGAYGFEERALGWLRLLPLGEASITGALMFRYEPAKGGNRVEEARGLLRQRVSSEPFELVYDVNAPQTIEQGIDEALPLVLRDIEEVVVDVSAMTKFLILVVLTKLFQQDVRVRIVYAEASHYAPSAHEFAQSRGDMSFMQKFPSQGFNAIIRARCLSSTRMQGQPVTLVAFTSFNEQLVRHMLGTISPHRLVLINGRPPRTDFRWREHAMQEIHKELITQHVAENPLDEQGHLTRIASTLDHREAFARISEAWDEYSLTERIICAATGSKMQTVGLALAKLRYPDIHVEYPTPDSYFVKGMSTGIGDIYEVPLPEATTIRERSPPDEDW